MKALSIQQPWAWAILTLGKDIENRDWKPTNPGLRFRGPVLIHTGLKRDRDGDAWLRSQGASVPDDLPLGGIVGKVTIADVVTASDSPWFLGPYGFVLRDPLMLPFCPLKGMLGFFAVDG